MVSSAKRQTKSQITQRRAACPLRWGAHPRKAEAKSPSWSWCLSPRRTGSRAWVSSLKKGTREWLRLKSASSPSHPPPFLTPLTFLLGDGRSKGQTGIVGTQGPENGPCNLSPTGVDTVGQVTPGTRWWQMKVHLRALDCVSRAQVWGDYLSDKLST